MYMCKFCFKNLSPTKRGLCKKCRENFNYQQLKLVDVKFLVKIYLMHDPKAKPCRASFQDCLGNWYFIMKNVVKLKELLHEEKKSAILRENDGVFEIVLFNN